MIIQFKKEDAYFLAALLGIAIVYSINLGLMPLLADEPIRALVSLEMVLSDNYIFPTLGGDAYLNKPPLFNWLIACLIANTDFSEGVLRAIPLISFFLISILHYVVCSKYVSKQIALWSSIAFLTCGRIIFYDSMMGYIDPVFALIIVANFYIILVFSKTNKYTPLFIFSYLLCTIAFFLKGLPACTFQAFTLAGVFIYRKTFHKIFSWSHLAGISIFMLCIAIYYYEYGSYASIEKVLRALISQSTQRTPVSTSIADTLLHIIQFPFNFIADFLPYSLLVIFCFNKKFKEVVHENDFVFVSLLIFGSNLWLYWLSAETRPRYLFMFLPMFFTVLFYVYEKFRSQKTESYISYLLIFIGVAALIAIGILPFLQRFNFIPDRIFIAAASIIAIIILLVCLFMENISNMVMLVLLLLVIRMNFNLFILPLRNKEAPESANKKIGYNIANLTKGEKLFLLYKAPVNDDILYYITAQKGEIIYSEHLAPVSGNYYIGRKKQLDSLHLTSVIYQFPVSYNNQTLYLVKK